MAGLYLLQQAEFLFAVQIVLYVGGIMVLFLFVIMLVNLDEAAKERQFNRQWLIALVAVAAVGAQVGLFHLPRQGLVPLRGAAGCRRAGRAGEYGTDRRFVVRRVPAAV